MKIRRFDVGTSCLVFCAVVLTLNLFVAIFSPSARYYRRLGDELRERASAFERRVTSDFVPSILRLGEDIRTNSMAVVSTPDRGLSLVSPGEVFDVPARDEGQKIVLVRELKTGFAGLDSTSPFAFLGNRVYRVGDLLCGSPILSIEPNCVFTGAAVYTNVEEFAR